MLESSECAGECDLAAGRHPPRGQAVQAVSSAQGSVCASGRHPVLGHRPRAGSALLYQSGCQGVRGECFLPRIFTTGSSKDTFIHELEH